jgi:hypothetical protein
MEEKNDLYLYLYSVTCCGLTCVILEDGLACARQVAQQVQCSARQAHVHIIPSAPPSS